MMSRVLLVLWCVWSWFPAVAFAGSGILVMGDSISAGFGLDAGQGWVHLLEQKLAEQGFKTAVVNASVSGETSAGGLARLPAVLERNQPAIVLIELGGNDGLRALPVQQMRDNLDRMIALSRAAGAVPVLFEMRIPSNYGPAYTSQFIAAFTGLSQERKVPLVPFFLAPLVMEPERWFQEDQLHPNANAQPVMLEAVWPTLEPLLKH